MPRTVRIILVMLALLITISVGKTEPVEAYSRCNVPIAARWDWVSNMRLYSCLSITTSTNLDAYNKSCQWSAIGVDIRNVTAYEYVVWQGGERRLVLGCRYTKGSPFIPGSATTCWVEATVQPHWYGGSVGWGYSIGPARSNYC